MQHRKNRRGLLITFFVMWCLGVLSFILGVTGRIDPGLAIATFLVAFICGGAAMLVYFFVVRCEGCGKVLFNLRIDPLDAPERDWREFKCSRCGDTTLVKGQSNVAESDHL